MPDCDAEEVRENRAPRQNTLKGDIPPRLPCLTVQHKKRASMTMHQTIGTTQPKSAGFKSHSISRGGTTANAAARIVIQTNQGLLPAKNPSTTSMNAGDARPLPRQTIASATISNAGTNANDTAPSTINLMLNRPDAIADTRQPSKNAWASGPRQNEGDESMD
jgi:hypothetical protein